MSLIKNNVLNAADKLAAKGLMPSIKMLRKEMGNTGSETTLLKYLREWKKGLLQIYTQSNKPSLADVRGQTIREVIKDLQEMLEG